MLFKQLEFKYPVNYIYFLLPLLALILFIMGYRKKERIMEIIRINIKNRFKISRIILITLGLTLITFSLLGPQVFKGFKEVSKKGLDIYFLIDTSKSMLVEDAKPDRISRAKKIIEGIIEELDGDRIGFIPFSSDAYIQMPLTDDYQLAGMFLKVIDTDMIAGGGTNIAAAIRLADNSFQRTSSSDKVVIILSDGEEHNPESLDILKSIGDKKLKVYTIGIGTKKGGLIPVYDSVSGQKIAYKKRKNGEFVVSHLKEDILEKLAASAQGSYYQSSLAGNEIGSLVQDISSLKRGQLKTDRIRKFKQLYQYFLGAGILLFLIAYLLPERRKAG